MSNCNELTAEISDPQTITEDSENQATSVGHSHKIKKATQDTAGIVKVVDHTESNDPLEALSANQGRILAETLREVIHYNKDETINQSLDAALGYLSTRLTAAYSTLALAEANAHKHAEASLIYVVNDTELNNCGLYTIQGEELVKAPWDALANPFKSEPFEVLHRIMTLPADATVEYQGNTYLSLATLGKTIVDGQTEISGIVQTLAATAGTNGWTDLLVATQAGRSQRQKNLEVISTKDASTPDEAAALAYTQNAKFIVFSNAKLVIDGSYNFKNVLEWAQNVETVNNVNFKIEVVDGLHNLSFFSQISGNVTIEGRATPTLIRATSYSFTLISGINYNVTVTLESALPTHVAVGYSIGVQNAKGDGSASAVTGAHIVKSIASDRLSFTFEMRKYGSDLVNSTVLDNAITYSLLANMIVIPQVCLRLDANGWNGNTVEGCISAIKGGSVTLRNIGLSYNGVTSEHDMLFATGLGSSVNLEDYVVVAGTGDKVLRSSYGGRFYSYRSCIGCGITGGEIFQGVSTSNATFIRCSMSGGNTSAITPTIDTQVTLVQSILASASIGLRPTYENSSIVCTTSKITQCGTALSANRGCIQIADDCLILDSTSFASISAGRVIGNPTITNVTTIAESNVYVSQGGYWQKGLVTIEYSKNKYIGTFSAALDFPSIPAHSFADLTMTATGVAFNDMVLYTRQGGTEPAQAIMYQAFVSAANTITVRAFNVSSTAIDKTAFTARCAVYRTT